MSQILEELRAGSSRTRARACQQAANDPAAVLYLDALVAALGDPEREVRLSARSALITMSAPPASSTGRERSDVSERLRVCLTDDDRRIRWEAVLILGRLGAPELRFLPSLVDALEAPEGDVRFAAARLLVETGRTHGEVRLVLLQLATTGSPLAREMAIHALRSLAPGDAEVAIALLEATREPSAPVRRAALAGLGAIRVPTDEVFAGLTFALEDERDSHARRIAAAALGQLGRSFPLPESALRALARARTQQQDPRLAGIARKSLPETPG